MEICFALNRRYAPYTKWLNRTFANCRGMARSSRVIDDAQQATSWKRRVKFDRSNYVVADALAHSFDRATIARV